MLAPLLVDGNGGDDDHPFDQLLVPAGDLFECHDVAHEAQDEHAGYGADHAAATAKEAGPPQHDRRDRV